MPVIKHEAPDLRRHVRSKVPIGIRIKGRPFTVTEWSLGGFKVDDYPVNGTLVGDHLYADFVLPYQGVEISFTTEVEVVRVASESGTLAARFLNLNAREREVLGYKLLGETRNGDRASL